MCSGNDSGNSCHAENFVVRHGLYRQNISTLEIHHHLMLMFENIVLRLHHLGRGFHRVQEWVGIHHEDYPFQSGRWRTCKHSAIGGTWFGKPIWHFSIAVGWCVQTVPSLVHAQIWYSRACHGGYQDTWWQFTKIDVWRWSFTSSVI